MLILIPSVFLVLQANFVFPYLFELLLGLLTFVSSFLVESQAPFDSCESLVIRIKCPWTWN